MEMPNESPSLTIKVYWNPPPTHIYHVGSREAMDAALDELRTKVEQAIKLDPELNALSPEQIHISIGWAGAQAQAIDTVDIVLRNLPSDYLQHVQEAIDNLRHGFLEAPRSGFQRILQLQSSYFGEQLKTSIVFEYELESGVQPSVSEELNAPLLTFSAPYPDHLQPGSPQWNAWIDSANRIDTDFQAGVADYLASQHAVELQAKEVEVKSLIQPPMAGPLIEAFYVDIGWIVAVLAPILGTKAAEEVAGRAIQAGLQRVRDRWPGKFPDDRDLQVAANKNELLRRVKLHMASQGYSGLSDECYTVFAHNRRIQGGYQMPIDQSSPMGWVIKVEHKDGLWEFKILNDPNRVELKTYSNLGELIASTRVDLMREHGELYDPNIPQ